MKETFQKSVKIWVDILCPWDKRTWSKWNCLSQPYGERKGRQANRVIKKEVSIVFRNLVSNDRYDRPNEASRSTALRKHQPKD
ncbi:unnamed protein product [Dovyalis caffra]|uniref:Uncharacterized protein n=1 Tax=Dovyalis caffra TaxID=77055 RepID=A0AAV1SCI8_9ROSI|nr:unnamed protein product [Dovyalis caffra]